MAVRVMTNLAARLCPLKFKGKQCRKKKVKEEGKYTNGSMKVRIRELLRRVVVR